jgi:imidazolonepropionase-like amidohydrolase
MTTLLIHNATLIDGTGADPRPATAILVEDGRITRIAPASALKPPRDAAVIDAAGRFLLPGLTDAHVHFAATDEYFGLSWCMD